MCTRKNDCARLFAVSRSFSQCTTSIHLCHGPVPTPVCSYLFSAHIQHGHPTISSRSEPFWRPTLSVTAQPLSERAALTATRHRSRFSCHIPIATQILPRSSPPAARRALTAPPFYSSLPTAHFRISPALARPHLLTYSPIPPRTTAKPRHFPSRTDCAYPILISTAARALTSSLLH